MKNLLIILTGLALIALSLWLTKAVFDSDIPMWMKWWIVK